jgi:TctA family transporter
MEAFGLLLHGFAVLMTWKTMAFMIVGLVLGIFVGVLPGLGGPIRVAILLPLTFNTDPTAIVTFPASIGAPPGGAITSICSTSRARPGRWRPPSTLSDGAEGAGRGGMTAATSFIGSLRRCRSRCAGIATGR